MQKLSSTIWRFWKVQNIAIGSQFTQQEKQNNKYLRVRINNINIHISGLVFTNVHYHQVICHRIIKLNKPYANYMPCAQIVFVDLCTVYFRIVLISNDKCFVIPIFDPKEFILFIYDDNISSQSATSFE